MNYDQRMAIISNWFKSDIIPRFNMPRDVDPKVSATDVMEAVNANISSHATAERIGDLLASITREIARSAKSRTLPTVKEFVDAARALTQSHKTATHSADYSPNRIDPLQVAIKRVRSGSPLCESWLKGSRRMELLRHVSEDDLRKYDLYMAAHKQ